MPAPGLAPGCCWSGGNEGSQKMIFSVRDKLVSGRPKIRVTLLLVWIVLVSASVKSDKGVDKTLGLLPFTCAKCLRNEIASPN
jgi:hypothetical protein